MYYKCEKLLKAKGLKIADMCRATGIAESVFANLKARGGNLSIKNALKVAEYLGVSIEDLTKD